MDNEKIIKSQNEIIKNQQLIIDKLKNFTIILIKK